MKSLLSLHRVVQSHCKFHMYDNTTPQIKIIIIKKSVEELLVLNLFL